MLFAMMALVMGANPATINKPRQDFAACIRAFETKSREGQMSAADYESGVKAACSTEAAALTKALIAYDMAMGGKRANAVANAASDVDDYRITSVERYRGSAPPPQ
ncbi:hypothetical protein H9L12_09215 [Sphingomonas rhizophila]|uniref:Uncharacterized protein n=1 Tax=Sphingomonas rhizophila TaxID=2071607 RepID=A0A7G9S9G8_9SPHN|nr:hypothetical protein [Sphingomonas rhizophila]QNN64493.1 hypothetical protein H9L12_09215 [Sphingomonas rhizophila]